MKKLNKKGFTIVELVIVIAVIAILAGVLIPTFANVVEKANQSAAMQEAAALYKEVYAMDLSDGVLDGNEGKAPLTSLNEKTFTYTVTDGKVTEFKYTNTKTNYTSKLNTSDNTWTVTKES